MWMLFIIAVIDLFLILGCMAKYELIEQKCRCLERYIKKKGGAE